MRLYLAGPMRGYPKFNFDAFEEATRALREAGHEVWSPHEHDLSLGFDPMRGLYEAQGVDLKGILAADLVEVLASDGVALLDGSLLSRGALAEIMTAMAVDIPLFHVYQALAHPLLLPVPYEVVRATLGRMWSVTTPNRVHHHHVGGETAIAHDYPWQEACNPKDVCLELGCWAVAVGVSQEEASQAFVGRRLVLDETEATV